MMKSIFGYHQKQNVARFICFVFCDGKKIQNKFQIRYLFNFDCWITAKGIFPLRLHCDEGLGGEPTIRRGEQAVLRHEQLPASRHLELEGHDVGPEPGVHCLEGELPVGVAREIEDIDGLVVTLPLHDPHGSLARELQCSLLVNQEKTDRIKLCHNRGSHDYSTFFF